MILKGVIYSLLGYHTLKNITFLSYKFGSFFTHEINAES